MFFEYLKLSKEDFKDFLIYKKFEIMEIPILDNYFSFDNKKETGYIISVQGIINKLLDYIIVNEWSTKTMQMMSALIFYQVAMNGLTAA